MPVAMLKVSGMAIIVTKAGIASEGSSHLTSRTARTIRLPTRMSAAAVTGEVATAVPAIAIVSISGVKKSERKKHPATTRPTNPVLPPAATPAADST